MNSVIAQKIGSYFSAEPWCEKMAGLVKTITYYDQNENNEKLLRRMPVDCNTSLDQCKSGRYVDLVPNSGVRSIFYFEDNGITLQKRNGDKFEFVSRLKLIGWLNLSMFVVPANVCSISDKVISQILKLLPDQYINFGVITEAKFRIIGEDIKSPAIFARYTFNEEQTQYLLYPYDYFALNLAVEFVVNRACQDDEIEIQVLDPCIVQ